jgi:hypothetical protein
MPREVLLWIREDFGRLRPVGRLVIHWAYPDAPVAAQPDKIGIDTGAVFGGPLSALQMPERGLPVRRSGKVVSFPLESL